MAMTVKEIVETPEFYDLPENERIKVIRKAEPSFDDLDEKEQLKFVAKRVPKEEPAAAEVQGPSRQEPLTPEQEQQMFNAVGQYQGGGAEPKSTLLPEQKQELPKTLGPRLDYALSGGQPIEDKPIKESWIQPDIVLTGGTAVGAKAAMKAGSKLFPAMFKGLTQSIPAAAMDFPIGQAADMADETGHPKLAFLLSLGLGVGSGMTIERLPGKLAKKTKEAIKAYPKVAKEVLPEEFLDDIAKKALSEAEASGYPKEPKPNILDLAGKSQRVKTELKEKSIMELAKESQQPPKQSFQKTVEEMFETKPGRGIPVGQKWVKANQEQIEAISKSKKMDEPTYSFVSPVNNKKIKELHESIKTDITDETANKANKILKDEMTSAIETSPNSKAAMAYYNSDDFDEFVKHVPEMGRYTEDFDPVRPKDARGQEGIAEIRQEGQFVHDSVADYFAKKRESVGEGEYGWAKREGIKDISKFSKQMVDPSRLVQEADQGLRYGPLYQNVILPQRDMARANKKFTHNWQARLEDSIVGHNVTKKKDLEQAYRLLDGQEASNPKPNVKAFADDLRGMLDELRGQANKVRAKRGQKPIPYREDYITYIKEVGIEELFQSKRATKKDLMGKPEMPDWLHPKDYKNPTAEKRTKEFEAYRKNTDPIDILGRYIKTTARDIFDTSTIQNNKVHAKFLKGVDMPIAADGIETWTTEAIARAPHTLDRLANTVPLIHDKGVLRRIQEKHYRGLMRSVFALNLSWNLLKQTGSHAFLPLRVGVRDSLKGLEVFSSPQARSIARKTYTHMQKVDNAHEWGEGFMETVSNFKHVDKRPKLDTVADKLNYFTKLTEKWLTDWAAVSGWHHGKRMGLKGRERLEFASDTAARVNSMYNKVDRPGALRSDIFRQTVPLQTFTFEAMNNVKEVMGYTGAHQQFKGQRAKRLIEFTAAMYAANLFSQVVRGDEVSLTSPLPVVGGEGRSWTAGSFLPVLGGYFYGGRYSDAGRPLVHKAVNDFRKAAAGVIADNDWTDARKYIMRYYIPAGLQIDRTIQGAKAAQKGKVKPRKNSKPTRMKKGDKTRAVIMGPGGTKAAKEFYSKQEKTPMEKILGRKLD